MKICAVIPAFNESRTIGGLIGRIRHQGLDVLVIDDGSGDDTMRKAREAGAQVLRNENNKGKGVSLIKGFGFARQHGCDAVLTLDGDGQHLPEDIPVFLERARGSGAGIFIGNRMTRARRMPLIRFLTNRFMSWLISRLAKQHIPDTQCGYRLIRTECLAQLELTTRKFEIESEILLEGARRGFRIESVPIQCVYAQEKSQINPCVDTLRFVAFIARRFFATRT
jgi:glycosyltransferase involved in cell wall biosynthesis